MFIEENMQKWKDTESWYILKKFWNGKDNKNIHI